jgi:hypothetical protein
MSGCPMSRRRLLGVAGATAAGAMLSSPGRAHASGYELPEINTAVRPDRFGRLFDLEPFAEPKPKIVEALKKLGAQGGIMDAGDDLAAGPLGLILNPGANRDNAAHTAGMTFIGQFIDHDLTLDATSPLGVETDPGSTVNGRSPAFDLDSVYGSGPFGDPLLYEADKLRLRVGARGAHEDVPRMPDGTPLIGDARNDENVAVNGLHAAFLCFHNKLIENGVAQDFKTARRLVTWHWQWIVLNEFLPLTIGAAETAELLSTRKLFKRFPDPFIPVEFQGASYRFGHSQVRPSYRMNFTGAADGGQRFAFVFDATQITAQDPTDMQGGMPGAGRHIGWPTFFRFPDATRAAFTRPNKTIDTKLSSPLFHLPPKTVRGPEDVLSLAQRNLLRHLTWSIPSGQRIAKKVGAPVLSADDLADLGVIHKDFPKSTPLWFYTLREADKFNHGVRLGPVGGLLVGGVIVGLMQRDPNCYLNAAPGWKPSLGATPGQFAITDLLDYAGVGGIR